MRGALLVATGLVVAAAGTSLAASVPVVALGLFVNGVGTGVWDVAMNVEGAAVERELGRAIMPRFHAAWSGGSILGATIGVPVNALDLPLVVHLGSRGRASPPRPRGGPRPASCRRTRSTADPPASPPGGSRARSRSG